MSSGRNRNGARFQLLDHAAYFTPGVETPFLELQNDNGITGATGFRLFTSTGQLYIRDVDGIEHNIITPGSNGNGNVLVWNGSTTAYADSVVVDSSGNLVPTSTLTYSLGSSTNRWTSCILVQEQSMFLVQLVP